MRSVVALAALALLGSPSLVGASRCKPSPPTTPGSNDPVTTPGLRKIRNEVTNGGLAKPATDDPNGIFAFALSGEVSRQTSGGYTGDKSAETSCAKLTAQGPGRKLKRAAGASAGLAQTLSGLDDNTPYTVRFYYAVLSLSSSDACLIQASVGSNLFFSGYVFTSSSMQWTSVLESVAVDSAAPTLSISMSCQNGAMSTIFVDSIFMSNQVTPENIDQFQLDFGDEDTSTTGTLTSGGATRTPGGSDDDVTRTPGAGTATAPGGAESTATGGAGVSTPGSNGPSTQTAPGPNTQATPGPSTQATPGSNTQATPRPGTATDTSPNTPHPVTGAPPAGATTDAGTPTTSTACTPVSVAPRPGVSHSGRCATLGSSSIAGRGCDMHPYNSRGGYSRFTTSDVSKEQCAALCLADDNCLSFEWTYQGSGCANLCLLNAASLSNVQGNYGPAVRAWDRSCITATSCNDKPASDDVCINEAGSTPGQSCSKVMGSLKAGVKPFVTASVIQYCGVSNQCRDLCAQYPSCRSFSTAYSSSNNCFLYSGHTSEIVESGGSSSSYFEDLDCYQCGWEMAFYKFVSPKSDPYEITCKAPTTVPGSQATTATTNAGESSQTTSAPASSPTSSGPKKCPAGQTPPGFCTPVDTTPAGSSCGVYGRNRQGFFGRTKDWNPRQANKEDCALLCSQEAHCKAFAWNPWDDEGGSCAMSQSTIEEDGIDLGVDYSMSWYDFDCYHCETCDVAGDPVATPGSNTTPGSNSNTTPGANNPGPTSNPGSNTTPSANNPGSNTTPGANNPGPTNIPEQNTTPSANNPGSNTTPGANNPGSTNVPGQNTTPGQVDPSEPTETNGASTNTQQTPVDVTPTPTPVPSPTLAILARVPDLPMKRKNYWS